MSENLHLCSSRNVEDCQPHLLLAEHISNAISLQVSLASTEFLSLDGFASKCVPCMFRLNRRFHCSLHCSLLLLKNRKFDVVCDGHNIIVTTISDFAASAQEKSLHLLNLNSLTSFFISRRARFFFLAASRLKCDDLQV